MVWWRVEGLGLLCGLPSLDHFSTPISAILTLDGDVLVAFEERLEGVRAAGEEEGHGMKRSRRGCRKEGLRSVCLFR